MFFNEIIFIAFAIEQKDFLDIELNEGECECWSMICVVGYV